MLISTEALGAVKVAIFMGDPRYIAGLPYEVGTCKTQGVRFCHQAREGYGLLTQASLHHGPKGFSVPTATRSSRSATLLIPSAATATTRLLTCNTRASTATRSSSLSATS